MESILFGAWRAIQAFLPLLRQSPAARVVNVSSGSGSHGDMVFGLTSDNAMGPGYGVAKAALNALTAAVAFELKGTGVLVNAVCPGFTATFPGERRWEPGLFGRERRASYGRQLCLRAVPRAVSTETENPCHGELNATARCRAGRCASCVLRQPHFEELG